MDIFSFEKFFSAYILDLSPISLMRSGFNIKCFNFSTQSDSEFTKKEYAEDYYHYYSNQMTKAIFPYLVEEDIPTF